MKLIFHINETKLLLTNRQVPNIRKAFAKHTSTDIRLSKAQLTKIQKGLTTAASATDAAINKIVLGSGNHTTLTIFNNDIQDHLKIVKSLENSGILLDGITETVKNEVKEQNAFRYFRSFFAW